MKAMTWLGGVVWVAGAMIGCGGGSSTGTGGSGTTSSTGTKSTTGATMTTGANMTTAANMSTGTGTAGCTVTLTGGVSKTLSCTVNAAYSASNDKSAIAINFANGEGAAELGVVGKLMAQNYTWSDSDSQGGSVLENMNAEVWGWGTENMMGASTVTVSSVDVASTSGSDELYSVHGSVTATAAPIMGSTTPVNVTVAF